MRRFLRDPLVHFLAAGALLFAVASAIKPADPAANSIVVDRSALLSFIQYRSKAFEAGAAESLLDDLNDDARAALVRDFVREEALAREAAALSLDANDYVIRQRMVQKAEFLAEAAAVADEPTHAEIAAFYEADRDRYASPPTATLTHVFVSFENRTHDAASEEAAKLLATMKSRGAGFNDATKYGERFLFHKNYVDRTKDYIESQLGREVVDAVFDTAGALNEWRGPYRSDYGAHVIFVTARAPARIAPLSEIGDLVKSDLVEERRQAAIDRVIETIVAKYKVEDRLSVED
ncbi:MAG: peptidyl-prolyl cis-trans isomerase [Pseudomonadota bacterium]